MLCPIHVLRYSSARRVVAQGVTDQTELPKHTVVLPVLTSPMKKFELNSKAGRQLQVCVRVCGVVVWVCGGMVVWWRGGVVVWGAVVGVVVAAAVAGVVNVRAQQQGRQAAAGVCARVWCGGVGLRWYGGVVAWWCGGVGGGRWGCGGGGGGGGGKRSSSTARPAGRVYLQLVR